MNSILEKHAIAEAFNPSADLPQWMAFIVLNHLNPNITYLSYDGYHCHGLADYKLGVRWQRNEVKDLKSGEVCMLTYHFEDCTTQEITNIWIEVTDWMIKEYGFPA